jgi:sulfur-carrier protein adenylyltransferase/sulfurtransferase
MFNPTEISRYSRHFSVDKIGLAGQKKIKQARVLCVGAGGIGSPALLYLAASGVGHLGVVDFDCVELSNLQRQILFREADCGQSKAQIAKQQLSCLNSNIEIIAHDEKLTIDNIEKIISQYDIVLDGSDNYPTRYLVNDACVLLHKPLISASIYQFSGQLAVFSNETTACYRCLYPNPPAAGVTPNCAQAGVLGAVPGVLGTLAATEVLKWILDFKEKLNNAVLSVDLLTMSLQKYTVTPHKDCLACTRKRRLQDIPSATNDIDSLNVPSINAVTLKQWIDEGKKLSLLDVRQPWEREICQIDNSTPMPLDQLPFETITLTEPIIIYCKVGIRSAQAVSQLKNRGHQQVYNLEGGILAWIREVNPDLMLY